MKNNYLTNIIARGGSRRRVIIPYTIRKQRVKVMPVLLNHILTVKMSKKISRE